MSINEIDTLRFRRDALLKHRAELIKSISDAADEIKRIDDKLAVVRSCELENDLKQAADRFAPCRDKVRACL